MFPQIVQVNWYIEWHFDCLILWALASTGELSQAEDLVKGLKSRLDGSFPLSSTPIKM